MTRIIAAILALVSGMTYPVAADEAVKLEAGAYSVAVRLELPHVETSGVTSNRTICVSERDRPADQGMQVLSENNPLANCPSTNVHQLGDTLTFDIICPGGNAARASAKYTLTTAGFDARIEMKMGGKNMTMTEVQSGHRAGICPTGTPHS